MENELSILTEALAGLRKVDALLEQTNAGISIVHLDACIASVESRIATLNGTHPLRSTQSQ